MSLAPDQSQQDRADLGRFGYAQELFRSMGGFSNFAISFSIISILTGAVTLFGYGLEMGGPVKGGKVYGQWPGLEKEQLYEGRDLALTTDFRDVLGELVSRHVTNGNLKAVFPGYVPKPVGLVS